MKKRRKRQHRGDLILNNLISDHIHVIINNLLDLEKTMILKIKNSIYSAMSNPTLDCEKFKQDLVTPCATSLYQDTKHLWRNLPLSEDLHLSFPEKPSVPGKPQVSLTSSSTNSKANQAALKASNNQTRLNKESKMSQKMDSINDHLGELTDLPQQLVEDAKTLIKDFIQKDPTNAPLNLKLGFQLLKLGFNSSSSQVQYNQIDTMKVLIDSLSDCVSSLKDHDQSMMSAVTSIQTPFNTMLGEYSKLINKQGEVINTKRNEYNLEKEKYHFFMGSYPGVGYVDNGILKISIKSISFSKTENEIWRTRFAQIRKLDSSRWGAILTGDLMKKYPVSKTDINFY